MRNYILVVLLVCFSSVFAQQNNITTVRDAYITIVTDARAAGQGDIGVATSPDAFSQLWNPSKSMFADEKFQIGITQIVGNRRRQSDEANQINICFYNQLNERSAYSFSFRGYTSESPQTDILGVNQTAHEISIDGAYTLRLSETFAMSVGGRFISLKDKIALLRRFSDVATFRLYGVDVAGFYYGNEIAFNKFNGRWRAGFNASNLRGSSLEENKEAEIYAPSTLKVGTGFDFIFSQDKMLAVTAEYKMLLDSYVENEAGEPLDFGLEGSVAALGAEFTYLEKLMLRAGYSNGINRGTDTFASIGAGLESKFVDIDVACLLGLSNQENIVRQNVRLSLVIDLGEVLFL